MFPLEAEMYQRKAPVARVEGLARLILALGAFLNGREGATGNC
jgi:hypothetical protein